MKNLKTGMMLILVLGCLVLLGCPNRQDNNPPSDKKSPGGDQKPTLTVVPVRIGYTNNVIINAHIGLIMARTNLLENNYLKGEVKAYDSDSLLLNDFNSGLLDIAFTSDFAGLMTLAKETNGLILGSFGSLGRVVLLVSSDLDKVQSISNLKGLKIGVIPNSNAHCQLLDWFNQFGLIDGQNISIMKTDVGGIKSALVGKIIDGAVLLDPEAKQYEQQPGGPYKRIADNRFYSLILVSRDFAGKNSESTKRFLTALKMATYYLTTHQADIDNMVKETKKITADIPNWAALNSIYMAHTADKVDISAKNILPLWTKLTQYFSTEKLIDKPFDLATAIDAALQAESERKLTPQEADLSKVKIIAPTGK